MSPVRQYVFGGFRLDASQRALFHQGQRVPITPKAMETLIFLVERRGRIVDKQELMQAVWPDTFVEEVSLARNISVLRKILAEGSAGQEFIETIPKRGYRFVGLVTEMDGNGQTAVPEMASRAQARAPSWKRLSWLALTVLLILAAAATALFSYWRRNPTHNALASQRVILAVLPVQNLTGDPSREYVSDGLTEEMIAQLGGMDPRRLGVIARTSSMSYKNTAKTVDQIGRELNADYVLESSLRQSGDRVRVTAQLIRAQDQSQLWSHNYDYAFRDLVGLEDEVGRAVASQIRLKLTPQGSQRLDRSRIQNPESYDLYMKGRYYWNQRSRDGLDQGLTLFKEAVQKDATNSRAYAGIADSYNIMLFYGYSPGEGSILLAKQAAQRAIELDETLPEGHAALGYAEFMWLWEFPIAEQEFRRAIELDQNYLSAHHWYALYLTAMGRQGEALEEIGAAQRIDPRSPVVKSAAGYIDFYARRYDASLNEAESALELDQNSAVAHSVLGLAMEGKGRYAEAIKEFERAFELTGNTAPAYPAWLGHACALAGRRDDAEKALRKIQELRQQMPLVGFTNEALIYAGLGDNEKSAAYLQRASQQNDPALIWLSVDPRYDSVRSDPRVQALYSRHDATQPR